MPRLTTPSPGSPQIKESQLDFDWLEDREALDVLPDEYEWLRSAAVLSHRDEARPWQHAHPRRDVAAAAAQRLSRTPRPASPSCSTISTDSDHEGIADGYREYKEGGEPEACTC